MLMEESEGVPFVQPEAKLTMPIVKGIIKLSSVNSVQSCERSPGLKEFLAAQLVNRLISLAAHISDRDLERVFPVAERIAPNEFQKSIVRAVARYWQEQHPAAELISG